jgi:hypothetical protein
MCIIHVTHEDVFVVMVVGYELLASSFSSSSSSSSQSFMNLSAMMSLIWLFAFDGIYFLCGETEIMFSLKIIPIWLFI